MIDLTEKYSGHYEKMYDTANSLTNLLGYSIEKLPYGNYASGLRNPIVSLVQATLGVYKAVMLPSGGQAWATQHKTSYPWKQLFKLEISTIGWAAFNLIWAGSTRFEPLKKASDYLGHLGATLFGVQMIFAKKTKYNVTKGLVDVTKMVALTGLLPKRFPSEKIFHALALVSTGMGIYKSWTEEE